MLTDGKIFDTSMREGRSPLRFQLGSGSLIKGSFFQNMNSGFRKWHQDSSSSKNNYLIPTITATATT